MELLLILSLMCLAWSIAAYLLKRRSYARCETAMGKVLDLVASEDEVTVYAPRIAFETRLGERVEFIENVYSSKPIARIGEEIRVIYDPGSPKDARVDRWFRRHGSEILLFTLGTVSMMAYIAWQFRAFNSAPANGSPL